MMLWLLIPGTLDQIDFNTFALGAAAALVVLFVIGLIVAKLVLDYFQADDDQKVWHAVDDILLRVRTPLRQQQDRPRTRARTPADAVSSASHPGSAVREGKAARPGR